jgi:FkbM family methyltransferase
MLEAVSAGIYMRQLISKALEAGLRGYSRVAPTGRGVYRLVRLARRFRPREQWRQVFRTPDGLLLDLDLGIYPDCCMAFGLYELDTARMIRQLLRPGDHFVDGGANIGYFTLMAAQWVGPAGRVDSFEPQPENRARLIENIRRNGLGDRVHVHPEALTDQSGSARIHVLSAAGSNHGCSSLFPGATATSGSAPVATARMDEVLAGTRPRLVKLDIQGAEPLAITGMTGLLQGEDPPALIAEYYPPCARDAGFAPREMVDRLLAIQPRYRVSVIWWRLRPLEPTDAALAALVGRWGEVNLLFQVP